MKNKVLAPLWFLFACFVLSLWGRANVSGNIGTALLALCVILLSCFLPDIRRPVKREKEAVSKVLAALVCIAAGWNFYRVFQTSSLIFRINQSLGWTENVLLILLTILRAGLSFCSSLLFFRFLSLLRPFETEPCIAKQSKEEPLGFKVALLLFLVALLTITICSKSSPIYPFNDWVDSNCFFTVGKMLANGRVLYRDIFEQKGPLLYVPHAIAYLISNATFLGVYFFEVLTAFVFLLFVYRIALLYCDKEVLFLIPLFAAMVYGSVTFAHGDSAEEMCLPLIAYALYVGLKSIRYSKPMSGRTYFLIGVTSGCVLWIKYTMLGFYIGWFIAMAWIMIAHNQWKHLWQSILLIAAGVLAISLPVFLYFAFNHAIFDFLNVYFYSNLFLYPTTSSTIPVLNVISNLCLALQVLISSGSLLVPLIVAGLIWVFIYNDKKVMLLFVCSLLSTIFLIYVGGQHHIYYALILAVFAIMALPAVYSWGKNTLKLHAFRNVRRFILCAACPILAFVLSSNTYMLAYKKEDLPQYRFKAIIETVDNPTLLNYGFLDGGFYTACNIVPTCKYFSVNNLPLKEMWETQNAFIDQGMTDFIVTRNMELALEKYDCIATEKFRFENLTHVYRLYALKELGMK